MNLHYKKEHISCVNYKSESYQGFGAGVLTEGDSFNNRVLSVRANFLIFILEGEVEVISAEGGKRRVMGGEFCFIPALSAYEIQVRIPGRYIYMSFLYNNIKLCEKYMLERYLDEVEEVAGEFRVLPVRHPLNLFLELMDIYLKAGVNCRHLHSIKEKELFIILRTSYTKQEIVSLFHEIIGAGMDFKSAVLLHAEHVTGRNELAQAMGMSVTDLARKFRERFGEPVYSWLLKQKKERILCRLTQPGSSIKEIVCEFDFSSAASFNRYCKKNFGDSPRELVKKYRIKYADKQYVEKKN